jgi:hypothetical protein
MEEEIARIQPSEPWSPSHCETAQAGIAIFRKSGTQSEKTCGSISEEATHRAEDGDESAQDGVIQMATSGSN